MTSFCRFSTSLPLFRRSQPHLNPSCLGLSQHNPSVSAGADNSAYQLPGAGLPGPPGPPPVPDGELPSDSSTTKSIDPLALVSPASRFSINSVPLLLDTEP